MGKKLLILSVDDDSSSQEAIQKLLRKKDFVVIDVPDGRTALEVAESVVLDLILIAVDWSKTEGFETAKKIKKHYNYFGKNVPIIAMVSSPTEKDREYFINHWIDKYISKPVNSQVLYPVILNYLPSEQTTSDMRDSFVL